MRRITLPCLLLSFTVACAPTVGQEKAIAEKEKIERLIKSVETMKDATFIRNDQEYSAANAARFLRGKWDTNARDIKTAADFIDKVGSASSSTGKAYLIRTKDGRETKSRDYLQAELKKIEGK